MNGSSGFRRGIRCSNHAVAGPDAAIVLCLVSVLSGLVAGCGGGLAPVQSPSAPAIPGHDRGYFVREGDTVYAIAWRYGVDHRALARLNAINEPFTVLPGQRLLIPEPGDVVPPPSEPATAQPKVDPPAADPSVVGVTVRPAGTRPAPVLEPLAPPEPSPAPAAKAPRQSLPGVARPSPAPKATAVRPDSTPKPVSKPAPKPVSSRPATSPTATRVAEGLRWSRPAQGTAIGRFGRGGNKGLDIAGTFEQPIRAASPGEVVYAGSGLVGYGKLIIVKHNDRLLSAYGHNERLHVTEGDEVQGGQHIADMGRSGKGRAMLHFEIRRDGEPVNPERFLP